MEPIQMWLAGSIAVVTAVSFGAGILAVVLMARHDLHRTRQGVGHRGIRLKAAGAMGLLFTASISLVLVPFRWLGVVSVQQLVWGLLGFAVGTAVASYAGLLLGFRLTERPD